MMRQWPRSLPWLSGGDAEEYDPSQADENEDDNKSEFSMASMRSDLSFVSGVSSVLSELSVLAPIAPPEHPRQVLPQCRYQTKSVKRVVVKGGDNSTHSFAIKGIEHSLPEVVAQASTIILQGSMGCREKTIFTE